MWCLLAGAVAGVGAGATAGWSGALVYLLPFVPFGIALFVIDWRTTLLPSWLVKPAYPVLVVLILVAWAIDRDLSDLKRAAWGWVVVGGWFLALWMITGGGGFGYGDVRLAGLIGPALGYLGWEEMLVGLMLIFVCGVVGAIAVAISQGSMRVRVPYGPFMLLGAWLGVLIGPVLAAAAGY